ncbi:serine/threonine-protein kinase [Geothrix sp. 21YS21S-2]|uniref:serine/threonine-protein kinase n=1 Tax=Geothrix sp. 21YS21S-2 TaxID=3068893 RepID=UPI0027BA604A|nr:serine/threonine-protein kinase [Geothrix sp. 21YS21S-2]
MSSASSSAGNDRPEPLRRAESLFHEVLEAPGPQRDRALESGCAGDAALRAEVMSLLEAHYAEEALASRWSGGGLRAAAAPDLRRVGPYRLGRVLGRGGMGAVYLADRVDGQFDQQVAVKLIDLPLATELFRERFRQERQILAGLVHPYIARLLDGGVSEEGEPYLVMEYVDGISLERFCRENRLTVRDRLLLFQKVCSAVHFAHQNLIVHRDLKSDNILVLPDGTPKLLDFGTAKLLAPQPLPGDFTRLGLQAFTPSYASPEQVLGEAITTASDTYSLGVLLFLLLAERPPYELKEGTTAELLRVVCTEQPPKPSAVWRSAEPPDADLDAIVLKAMRKEPQERYHSVDGFARDIQAFLDGRPVLARRGSHAYRAAKFIRRNWLVLGAAALLCLSLVAGLAGVLWQVRVARLERKRAEARSEDMRQLSNSLLSEIDEAVKQLPGSTPVRRLLVERVLEHLDHMARDVAGDRRTRLDLVNAYTRLGNLQGNPYDQNIGDREGALVSLGKALVLARALCAGAPGDPDLLGVLALAEQSRSEVLFGIGRTSESVVSMRAAVDAFVARAAGPGATATQIADAGSAWGGLGDQLGQTGVPSLGDPEGAIQAYRMGLACAQRALAVDPGHLRSRRALAISHFKIANVLAEGDPVKAVEAYHLSLAAWEAIPAADRAGAAFRRGIAHTCRKLGLALKEIHEYKAALAAFREARATYEYFAGADPRDTRAQYDLTVELSNEAETLWTMADRDLNPHPEDPAGATRSAVELLVRSMAVLRRLVVLDPGNQGWVTNLAYDEVMAGTLAQDLPLRAQGAQWSASGIAVLKARAQEKDAAIPTLDHATSALLSVRPEHLRNPGLAVQFAQRLVAISRRRKPDFMLSLAEAYHAQGRLDLARSTAKEGLALLPPVQPGAVRSRLRKLLERELRAKG